MYSIHIESNLLHSSVTINGAFQQLPKIQSPRTKE